PRAADQHPSKPRRGMGDPDERRADDSAAHLGADSLGGRRSGHEGGIGCLPTTSTKATPRSSPGRRSAPAKFGMSCYRCWPRSGRRTCWPPCRSRRVSWRIRLVYQQHLELIVGLQTDPRTRALLLKKFKLELRGQPPPKITSAPVQPTPL